MANKNPMGERKIALQVENELRAVLRDSDFDPRDALRCIDEILARYTGCGNAMPAMSDAERKRLENCYPRPFDWNVR